MQEQQLYNLMKKENRSFSTDKVRWYHRNDSETVEYRLWVVDDIGIGGRQFASKKGWQGCYDKYLDSKEVSET